MGLELKVLGDQIVFEDLEEAFEAGVVVVSVGGQYRKRMRICLGIWGPLYTVGRPAAAGFER